MSRRQRHLNARHAGVLLAFDARLITGVSNGSSVATWVDQSANGNDAVSSGAKRPVYTTGAINGQPALQFTATSPSFLDGSTALTGDVCSVIAVATMNSATQANGRLIGIRASGVNDFAATSSFFFGRNSATAAIAGYRNTGYRGSANLTYDTPAVVSTIFDAANNTTRVAGAAGTPSASTGTFAGTLFRIGDYNAGGGAWTGLIGALIVIPSSSSPLIRRLEQSLAAKFKLSCS